MDARLFYHSVVDHTELEWLSSVEGNKEEENGVIIGCTKTGHKFFIALSAIIKNDWETLSDILFGKRQPRIMSQMTRIVGYYAYLHNFNESKQQEVIDRRRGNYIIPGDNHVYNREVAFADSTCLPTLQRNVQSSTVGEQEKVLLTELPKETPTSHSHMPALWDAKIDPTITQGKEVLQPQMPAEAL